MTGSDDSSATPVGTGIVLNNAVGVSLTRMYVHDHSNYGIRGTGVSGFTLDHSVVSGVNGTNVAAPYDESSISFDNLAGTSAITNSAITGGYARNIRVDNTTASAPRHTSTAMSTAELPIPTTSTRLPGVSAALRLGSMRPRGV